MKTIARQKQTFFDLKEKKKELYDNKRRICAKKRECCVSNESKVDGREMVFDVVFKGTSQENGTVSDDGTVAFYGSSIRSASKETLEKDGIK